jgi:hypothetical protein
MEATRNIQLPEELCEAVERRFVNRFGSVEECLIAVLSELVREDALKLDEREQHIIENRLRALGYV